MPAIAEELEPWEVDWWEAFDAIEPIGPRRELDLLSEIGAIAAHIKGIDVKPDEFLAWRKAALPEPGIEISGEQSLAMARAGVMRMAGG